jgi:hypothetical protein
MPRTCPVLLGPSGRFARYYVRLDNRVVHAIDHRVDTNGKEVLVGVAGDSGSYLGGRRASLLSFSQDIDVEDTLKRNVSYTTREIYSSGSGKPTSKLSFQFE